MSMSQDEIEALMNGLDINDNHNNTSSKKNLLDDKENTYQLNKLVDSKILDEYINNFDSSQVFLNTFKNEFGETLEQLLSKNAKVIEIIEFSDSKLYDEEVNSTQSPITLSIDNIDYQLFMYLPVDSATSNEYYMLGGMGDKKEHIDDEVMDCNNELVSNIMGSFCTSANALEISIFKSSLGRIKDVSLSKDFLSEYSFYKDLMIIYSFNNTIFYNILSIPFGLVEEMFYFKRPPSISNGINISELHRSNELYLNALLELNKKNPYKIQLHNSLKISVEGDFKEKLVNLLKSEWKKNNDIINKTVNELGEKNDN